MYDVMSVLAVGKFNGQYIERQVEPKENLTQRFAVDSAA